jgi:glycosyltransferase involved in cell wall biosynthesis
VTHFGLAPEAIVVTPEAPAGGYQPLDRDQATSLSARSFGVSDHILAFASAAPRKNTHRLMQAYAALDHRLQARHPLALVCTHAALRASLRARAEESGIAHRLVLVQQPSDRDLLHLYNAAALFLFPSLEEGFGLPPLEAMACGTPVVASDTSSMPEVLGDAAMLVDPTDTSALTGAMTAMLTSEPLRQDYAHRGLERCSRYSWARTAERTLAVYERVAGRSAGAPPP